MSQDGWDRLLVALGFNCVEGSVEDWPGTEQCVVKTMWSTKLPEDIEDEEPDATGEVTTCGITTGTNEQLARGAVSSLEHLKPEMIHSPFRNPRTSETGSASSSMAARRAYSPT